MDRFSKYTAIAAALRNQECELELVNRLHAADGTITEQSRITRAVCRKVSRKAGATVLTFADIDLAALDRVFPFETFTVADFPQIFEEHVGRRIAQGVGTVVKVPLTWVQKTGGVWRYAGPKVRGTPGTLLTVYRGAQAGQGAVVNPSEYTTNTMVGLSSGVTVNTVDFTREQLDFGGRPYVLEADYLLAGSRYPCDELARILQAFGLTTDGATFAAGAIVDAAAGFAVDALYGDDAGRTGRAIIADLSAIARAWLTRNAAGAWAIVQDAARASAAQFDTAGDELELTDEYGDGELVNTVRFQYRPKLGSSDNSLSGELSRSAGGANGELLLKSPYVRDHAVADRFVSYWTKRKASLRQARAAIYAANLNNGDRLTITDNVFWSGAKDFIVAGITRPADRNEVQLREYDASIYTYTAGTLPADATSGYAPDYSYTPPAAPTSLAVISQGAAVDPDGTMLSFALIRAVPPSVNWQRLMVLVTNTVTSEVYQGQLVLNAGNYETRISGLRPNVAHTVIAWAVNANNIDGAATSPVSFTTTTFSTSPAVPTSLTYVGGNANTDANGIVTADALIRATPPTQFFKRLMAQVKDTSTGAVMQQQLLLNGGNYESRFYGLLPNRAHEVIAWAVNASADDGSITSPVSFTSATNSSVPSTPTPAAIDQIYTRVLTYRWPKVTPSAGNPPIVAYVVEESVSGGAFTEIWRGDAISLERTNRALLTVYQFRVKARDQLGNESAYATSSTATTQRMLTDDYIVNQGVSGVSIANGSINRGRSNTGTGSASGTISAGGSVGVGMDYYTFFPAIYAGPTANAHMVPVQAAPSDDFGTFRILSTAGSDGYAVNWRSFSP